MDRKHEEAAGAAAKRPELQVGFVERAYPASRVFWEFFAYSFFGLVFETLYAFVVHGVWTVRGTLGVGLPIIHIYGIGVILVVYLLGRFRNRPVVFFLTSAALMTLVELAGSYLEEALIGVRSWNYLYLPFNFDGRISLPVSIGWGFLSYGVIVWIHPRLGKLLERLPRNVLVWSSIPLFFYVLAGIARKYFLKF